MSRAWQAERAAEREQKAIDAAYERGEMTRDEHNAACREIEREMRAVYEEDVYDAHQAVRDEWGW